MKLLIADDEVVIQQGLFKLPWNSAGITEVNCTDNGAEALKMLCSFQPDIMLADIQMPGLTGLELAHVVKDQGKACKLILLSGYGTFEYAREAIKYGVFEYLLKPSSPQEIIDCVRRAVLELEKERVKKKRETIEMENSRIFSREEKDISDILRYIEQNYMTDITLSTLSEQMHFSTAYLSKLIKKETGYNFIWLVTMMRMLKAAELLTTTSLKVYSICDRVGIADQRYFSQVFRRTFGHTPMEYQKLNTQKNYSGLMEFIRMAEDQGGEKNHS